MRTVILSVGILCMIAFLCGCKSEPGALTILFTGDTKGRVRPAG
jgi:hypothetical protein